MSVGNDVTVRQHNLSSSFCVMGPPLRFEAGLERSPVYLLGQI
jgi:hypothetical protein